MQDPVCGMAVEPSTAAAAWEHDGTTYLFCSVGVHATVPRRPGALPVAHGRPADDVR